MQSELEKSAAGKIDILGLSRLPILLPYQQEYKFHPTRRWKFDFAWVERKIAIEINGGSWVSGRHNNAVSLELDYEKLNEAQMMGWQVFQLTGNMLKRGDLEEMLLRIFNS